MKLFVYIFVLSFHFCESQSVTNNKKEVFSVKDSIVCLDLDDKYKFEIPYIGSEDESNYFNSEIINDYIEYFGGGEKSFTPRKLIECTIKYRKNDCEINKNFSGFIGSNYIVNFNNSKLLSVTMNYELLAGNLAVDSYYYNFDVELKKRLFANEIFKETKIRELILKCNHILKQRLNDLYQNNESELNNSEVYNRIKEHELFNKENLNGFIIKKDQFLFVYNFGFPNGMFDLENNLEFSAKDLDIFFTDDFKEIFVN